MTPYVFIEDLTNAECQKINEIVSTLKPTKIKLDAASFSADWINYTEDTEWLYERLHETFSKVNHAYKFDDLIMIERIGYFEYEKDDFFDYHTDLIDGVPFSSRRIGMQIMLSSSDDYRGGQLTYMVDHKPYSVSRAAGTIVTAPAYVLKKIEPVTSGKRKCLVAWISSPNFKQK